MASGISNADQFVLDLRREAREAIPGRVRLVRDRLTLGVHRRMVLATPVDTGFHRASWTASSGQPDESTPEPGAPSYPLPDTPGTVSGSTPGQPWESGFVTNAAPAIVPLNEGSSQQAPAHFVQRAIDEEVSSVGSQ